MTNQGSRRSGRKTGKKWLCFRSRSSEVKAERRQLEKVERREGAAECGDHENLETETMGTESKTKQISLVPKIYAGDLPNDASEELIAAGISTHYRNDVFYVEWSDEDDYPNVKRWLTSTYGESVKKYDTFALIAT